MQGPPEAVQDHDSSNRIATGGIWSPPPYDLLANLLAGEADPQPGGGVGTAGSTPSKVPHKRPHATQINFPTTQSQTWKSTQIPKPGTRTTGNLNPKGNLIYRLTHYKDQATPCLIHLIDCRDRVSPKIVNASCIIMNKLNKISSGFQMFPPVDWKGVAGSALGRALSAIALTAVAWKRCAGLVSCVSAIMFILLEGTLFLLSFVCRLYWFRP
ncbi:hypothetical protein DSO57_1016960 [Entomophthora muscae]|uniref:Uncharacterized protein n=1 Tax=Entomophthora muscae TaxID=34485 RepID=A0ACC2UDZ8_9FUNG|nr:hypothetical protein DSO57_1016960 [Entomophthora muscae]